jgi:hypothetical protein
LTEETTRTTARSGTRTIPGTTEEQPAPDGADDRATCHGEQEAPVGGEHGEGPVPAVAGEGHQHRGQRHGERQRAGRLDVDPVEQHDRRDEELAAGHAHQCGHHADGRTGQHTGDRLQGALEQRRPEVP